MGWWVAFFVVSVSATAPAYAADPCRAACRATKVSCLADVKAAFKTAKLACATDADRRACVAAARLIRNADRTSCKTTFKECRASCGGGGGSVECGSTGDWLTALNFYRALAGVGPVTENAFFSAGDALHATYMVNEDVIAHSEDPSSPFFTPEGDAAANNSNLTATSDPDASPNWAVDSLMRAPFHGVGFIDPRLIESGFGIAHDTSGSIQTAAAIDVLSNRASDPPAGLAFPLIFPGNGTTVPLDSYPGNESPEPLTSCPGYEAPTGLPLIVQLDTVPSVTTSSLARAGTALEHCIFDSTTYVNPDPAMQSLGRQVLAARSAIFLIPRETLTPGTYDVSITTGGSPIAWSFTVDCQ
jgi:hypothetical protein